MGSQHLVFVYGTLREGHSNHHLLKNAHCYGVGSTKASYALYITKGYPYITRTDARYPIVGELYSVDDDTLLELDKFEGHPQYYKRSEIPVIVGEKQYAAWAYFHDPPGELQQSGDFNDVKDGKV